MKRWTIALIALGVLAGCRRSPETRMAREVSDLATTPQQKQLWQQAGNQAQAPGLQNLDKDGPAVQTRQRPAVSNQVIPPQGAGLIPSNVMSAIRVLSTAGLEDGEFGGTGTVNAIDASGERVTLELGNNKTIQVQVRAGGRPLAIKPGTMVSLDYRVRYDPVNRRQILAIRAPDGSGIARITETGTTPLTVNVPLFGLTATQTAGRGRGRSALASVEVRVGNDFGMMSSGQTAQIGGLTVWLTASRTGAGVPAGTLEGGAYALELVAWR